MNILIWAHFAFHPYVGGVERVSLVLGRQFEKDGHHVVYLSWHTKVQMEMPKDYQIEQHLLPDSGRLTADENVEYVAYMLTSKQIDVVLNQQCDGAEYTRLIHLARERAGRAVKLISVLHFAPDHVLHYADSTVADVLHSRLSKYDGFDVLCRNTTIYKRYIRRRVCRDLSESYRLSDQVVLLSDTFRDDFLKMVSPADGSKLLVIPNPLTCSAEYHPEQKKINEVVYVGRLEYLQKRPDYILKIWARVCHQFPDWHLTIVGDGSYRVALQQLIADMELTRVGIEGFSSTDEYYQRAKILCLTSTTEGFGLAIVEASNYGVVPIAFGSYSSVNDVIKDGETGFVIPPFNLASYSRELADLMRDEQRRQRMSEAAHAFAKTYEIGEIVKHWYRLFEA